LKTTGATPVLNLYNGSDSLIATFLSTGFLGVGLTTPLTAIHATTTNTASGAVTDGFTVERTSSGGGVAGYGTNIKFLLKSSTTAQRPAGTIAALWNSETDASYKADMVWYCHSQVASVIQNVEIMRGRANGTAPMFAVLGTAPAIQQTGGAATATVAYTATEQAMLQKAYDALRAFGFLS
jgi:hypothetical protein